MNKLIGGFLVGVITLAAIGGGWYFFATKTPPVNEDIAQVKTQNFSEPLLLTVINNNVQIKEITDSQPKEVVEKSVTIYEGTQVKTSLTGRAVIESNTTTTAIDKNSEFTIVRSTENQSNIYLALGGIWAKVQKVFDKGEYYQIQTNNAVITVRGTSFGVSYGNDKKTILLVTEGIVWLLSVDPITKMPIGQEVKVGAGQKATVTDGALPLIQPISNTDKKVEWYVFNNKKSEPPSNSKPLPVAPLPDKPTVQTPPKIIDQANPTSSNPISNNNPAGESETAAPPPESQTGGGGGSGVGAPASEIFSVNPKAIYPANGAVNFSIDGQGFDDVVLVYLNETSIDFSLINSRAIAAVAPKNIEPGVYDVSVVFPDDSILTLPQALSIR